MAFGFRQLTQISLRLPTDLLEQADQLVPLANKAKRFDLINRSSVLRQALDLGLVKLASDLKPPKPKNPHAPTGKPGSPRRGRSSKRK